MTKSQIIDRLEPLLEEAKEKCEGIFDSFQLNEDYQISLTLSVKEIRDLKEISDPRLRKRIEKAELRFLGESV